MVRLFCVLSFVFFNDNYLILYDNLDIENIDIRKRFDFEFFYRPRRIMSFL